MTRILTLSLVLALSVVALAGCGQSEQEPASEDQDQQGQQEKASPDAASEEGDAPQEAEPSTPTVSSILSGFSDVGSLKYDVVVNPANGEEHTATVWWKGDQTKAESTMSMQGRDVDGVYLLDESKNEAIAYSSDMGRAIKMDYSRVKKQVGISPEEQTSEIQSGAPKITSTNEVWDGKDCVVVEYTDDQGNTGKTWIWKEHGLPVRSVHQTSQGESVMELKNIEFTNIPDSEFELPAGVEVMELPTGIMN